MSKTLVIVQDPPYGTERCYNALRLANAITRRGAEELRVFLLGDSVGGALVGQNVPQGYYRIENMLRMLVRRECAIGVCSSCMDARGLRDEWLAEGCHRSSMDELAEWTLWADRTLVF